METFFQQPLDVILARILALLPRLMLAMVVFLIALWLSGWIAKLVRRAAVKRNLDAELVMLFSRLARWSVIILGTVVALEQVNFNVVAFVGGLGILGFTVGFALKDIAENFVAGILLLWQQPFNIGESISVNGYSGSVTDISLRATEIRTFDGLLVFIPNAIVYSNPLTNLSKVPKRRVDLAASVDYATDLEQASRVALEAVRQVPGVILDAPAPAISFETFGDKGINFTLSYWINTAEIGFQPAKDAGLKAINQAFGREGITMPHFKGISPELSLVKS